MSHITLLDGSLMRVFMIYDAVFSKNGPGNPRVLRRWATMSNAFVTTSFSSKTGTQLRQQHRAMRGFACQQAELNRSCLLQLEGIASRQYNE